jgi:hypothetical protein
MLQPQIDNLVRMMDRYMMNPSERNRERRDEAFAQLMEQGGNVSDMIQEMFDDLPHMARGGVVTKPTVALIGEAGPEVVAPLGGGGAGATYVFNGPVMSWRDFDRAAAAGVARKSRGF